MSEKRIFKYIVCGVGVQSEVEFSELAATSQNVTGISVVLGDTTIPFEADPVSIKPFSKFNKSEFFFELPGVIRFLVRNGSEIRVEYLTSDITFANQFLYSNALPIALTQRGEVLFKASGIIDADDNAWLFFAQARTGMTSTALFLMERGYRFFSDRIVSLRLDGTEVLASPFCPSMHIWGPVLDKQVMFKQEDLRPIREAIPKFVAKVSDDKYDFRERKVQGLLEIEHLTNDFSHNKTRMVEAFEVLRNAIYLNHLTSQFGLEARMFGVLSQMAKQTHLLRVMRPKYKESFHELAEYLDVNVIQRRDHA